MVEGGSKISQGNFGENHLKSLDLNSIHFHYDLCDLGKSLSFFNP